jgi:hypothetical protein
MTAYSKGRVNFKDKGPDERVQIFCFTGNSTFEILSISGVMFTAAKVT